MTTETAADPAALEAAVSIALRRAGGRRGVPATITLRTTRLVEHACEDVAVLDEFLNGLGRIYDLITQDQRRAAAEEVGRLYIRAGTVMAAAKELAGSYDRAER